MAYLTFDATRERGKETLPQSRKVYESMQNFSSEEREESLLGYISSLLQLIALARYIYSQI